jgi:hypothetical protein
MGYVLKRPIGRPPREDAGITQPHLSDVELEEAAACGEGR